MTTIALLSQKGGSGKSTLAIHLSVLAGPGTLLVDLDPQKSAAGWYESRQTEWPHLAIGHARDLPRALRTLERGHWGIVDTAPHAEEAADIVANNVDYVVIPSRPAILDLRAIGATVEIVRRAGARAVIVLNSVPPSRGVAEASVVSEARRVLDVYGLPVCPIAIGQRVSLTYALNDGRAVTEFEPDGRAADEMMSLWRWLNGQARTNET